MIEKDFKLIRHVVCTMFVVSFVFGGACAETKTTERNDLKQTILADNIVLCSDLPELNEATINQFMENAFPEKTYPKVVDASKYKIDSGKQSVFFFVAGKNPSENILSCLENFPSSSIPFKDKVIKISDELGKKPTLGNIAPLGHLYGPVKARSSYSRRQNWFVVFFLTIESRPYRAKHALVNLFGLDMAFCTISDACDFLDKKQEEVK